MHAPMRTCVGCRAVRPQAELLRARILLADDGEKVLVVPDEFVRTCSKRHGLSASGRSAYVCPARACYERAARRGGFARAFARKMPAVDPAALWNAHGEALAGMIDLLNRSGGIATAPRVQRLAALATAMRAAVGRVS
ncbi:YlxR family protein [Nannocystis punicea]|uniref:YlxR family protein n=1 Tax=Nannocystis punicea TaxID=2995304 RepID=A0ABY7HEW5_9BACT|nr:YlxR family protein [Nannocystis poenicansa]WAS97637.1 YlxR family protein [Nannocystis poenicansa]